MEVVPLRAFSLLMSRRPLRAAESALLNRAFLGLLDHAVHPQAQETS